MLFFWEYYLTDQCHVFWQNSPTFLALVRHAILCGNVTEAMEAGKASLKGRT